jgi:hypothetical protein
VAGPLWCSESDVVSSYDIAGRDELVLLTFGGGDGQQRAGDGGVVRAGLGDSVGILQWGSSPGDPSCGGGGARGSSSRGQFGAGGGATTGRQWHL